MCHYAQSDPPHRTKTCPSRTPPHHQPQRYCTQPTRRERRQSFSDKLIFPFNSSARCCSASSRTTCRTTDISPCASEPRATRARAARTLSTNIQTKGPTNDDLWQHRLYFARDDGGWEGVFVRLPLFVCISLLAPPPVVDQARW